MYMLLIHCKFNCKLIIRLYYLYKGGAVIMGVLKTCGSQAIMLKRLKHKNVAMTAMIFQIKMFLENCRKDLLNSPMPKLVTF